MELVAKTEKGFLVGATSEEIKVILNAVFGEDNDRNLKIGQRIPAIDYATTIRKLKMLKSNYAFKELVKDSARFCEIVANLSIVVENASSLE